MTIDDSFINNLKTLCVTYPGEHNLNMKLVEEKVALDFKVAAMKVDVNSAFIEEIRAMGLSYKLN